MAAEEGAEKVSIHGSSFMRGVLGKFLSSGRLAALNSHMDCRMDKKQLALRLTWSRGWPTTSFLTAQRPAARRNVVRRSKEKVGVSFRLGFGQRDDMRSHFFDRAGRIKKFADHP